MNKKFEPKERPMYGKTIKIPEEALLKQVTGSSGASVTYILICSYLNEYGYCNITDEFIAKTFGKSIRTAKKYIKLLEQNDFICTSEYEDEGKIKRAICLSKKRKCNFEIPI